MTEPLQSQAQRAVEFLAWLLQGAPFHLFRMESEGDARPVSKVYQSGQQDDARQFIAMNNSAEYRRNIYFVANAEFLEGARKKVNLHRVRFLQIDVDAKDFVDDATTWEQALDLALLPLLEPKKRPPGVPEPSCVIFTGGGYQAFWCLAEPMEVQAAEDLNSALIEIFGGDVGTQDAVHLMRVPFTVNWPNKLKRDRGRVPGNPPILSGAHP